MTNGAHRGLGADDLLFMGKNVKFPGTEAFSHLRPYLQALTGLANLPWGKDSELDSLCPFIMASEKALGRPGSRQCGKFLLRCPAR